MRQRKASFLPKGPRQVERLRKMNIKNLISSRDIVWEDDLKVTIFKQEPQMVSVPKLMGLVFDRSEFLLRCLIISWGCWLVTILSVIYLMVRK